MEENTSSKFWMASLPAIVLLFIMWFVFFLDLGTSIPFKSYGIAPLYLKGLRGVFAAPILHGSLEHIFNNSIPTLVLVWALFYSYRKIALKVLFYIWIVAGILVWITGSKGVHIGMSGVIYGLSSFLFLSGFIRKTRHLMGLSLLVVFLYGSLIWGVFPVKEGISWEGHLWGGITGLIMAIFYRKEGEEERKFSWELEEEDPGAFPYWLPESERPKLTDVDPENKDIKINYIYKEKPTTKDES